MACWSATAVPASASTTRGRWRSGSPSPLSIRATATRPRQSAGSSTTGSATGASTGSPRRAMPGTAPRRGCCSGPDSGQKGICGKAPGQRASGPTTCCLPSWSVTGADRLLATPTCQRPEHGPAGETLIRERRNWSAGAAGRDPVRRTAVKETWVDRDLPVLDATVSLLEESYMVTVSDIADRTGLDLADVSRALETLDPTYLDFRKTTTGGDPRFWYVHKATPEGRRAVGQWPTPEALITSLAGELTAAAERETDPERKGLLSYSARLLGDTLRDLVIEAAARVLTPAVGPWTGTATGAGTGAGSTSPAED